MRNETIASLLLVAILAQTGLARDNPESTFPTLGIAVKLPPKWTHELTSGQTRLLCREFPVKGDPSLLSVHTEATNASMGNALKHHREHLKAVFPRSEIVREDAQSFGLTQSHFLHVKNLAPTQPAKELFETILRTDNHLVFLSLYFPRGQMKFYEDLFHEVVRSTRSVVPPTSTESGTKAQPSSFDGTGTIVWRPSFDEAFREAKDRGVPVLIAFNMDGESVCDSILKTHYQDPEIVALSRDMVCLIASAFDHGGTDEVPCPRFSFMSCGQHRDIEMKARQTYLKTRTAVAPQHLICFPDGRLLTRREYMLPRRDLQKMMRGAARSLSLRSRYFQEGKTPDFYAFYRSASTDEERAQVISDVLYCGVENFVRDLLTKIGSEHKSQGLLNALKSMGASGHPDAAQHAIHYLGHNSEFVRAQAAATLASMGLESAVPSIKKRLRVERIDRVSQHLLRALGTCAAGDSSVATLLLRQARTGPSVLRISALLSLAHFPGDSKVSSGILRAYRQERNHEVKAVAALLLGYHQVETATPYLEKDLVGVGKTRTADMVRWALLCIRGEEDPTLGFDTHARIFLRDLP